MTVSGASASASGASGIRIRPRAEPVAARLFVSLALFPVIFTPMAPYDRLPVYKASYDLLLETFQFVKTFSREYKYTLGESVKRETLELIREIYRANGSFDKRK